MAGLPIVSCSPSKKKASTPKVTDPTSAPTEPKARFWEQLRLGPNHPHPVRQLGEDSSGGLWMISGSEVYYWDAESKLWQTTDIEGKTLLDGFHGNRDSGLHLIKKADKSYANIPVQKSSVKVGAVLLLNGGKSEEVAEFHYNGSYWRAGFHVIGKDHFLNWTQNSLRIYSFNKESGTCEWVEQSANLPQHSTHLYRGDGMIALISTDSVYVINAENQVRVFGLKMTPQSDPTKMAMWGGHTLVIGNMQKKFVGMDLRTGETTELTNFNETLAKSKSMLSGVWSMPDGSVRIQVFDLDRKCNVFLHAKPGGELQELKQAAGLQISQYAGKKFAHDSRGALWEINAIGVHKIEGDDVLQFDHRLDGSPPEGHSILCDNRNIVYVGGPHGVVFAYNLGTSLGGDSPYTPPKTIKPGNPLWQQFFKNDRTNRVWQVDDMIIRDSPDVAQGVVAHNASDGKERFRLSLGEPYPDNSLWVGASTTQGQLLVFNKTNAITVDSTNGKILHAIKVFRDLRIPPIPMKDGFLIADGRHAGTLSRYKSDGYRLWTTPRLTRYVQMAPSECYTMLLVQTESDNDGSRETVAFDGHADALLWKKQFKGKGSGIIFMPDPLTCIDVGGSKVIARETISGDEKWSHNMIAGASNSHPMVHPKLPLIYLTHNDGTVTCLDSDTGRLAWTTKLPVSIRNGGRQLETPRDANTLLMLKERLVVFGEDLMLYVLDAEHGTLLHRIQLVEDELEMSNRLPYFMINSGPWVVGERLIFTFGRKRDMRIGIKAFDIKDLLVTETDAEQH